MLSIATTDEWAATHPEGGIGILEVSGVENARACPELEERKRAIETELRRRYGGCTRKDLLSLPVARAYDRYYRRFGKTYHVQLQVESIAFKGRSLPSVSPAVDANFMAEVDTFVLAAGHDAVKLHGAVLFDVARSGDRMVQMNGATKDLRPGDMVMRDEQGIACSIIYGQDDRSPISPQSSHLLYAVYAPAGVDVEQVELHLRRVEEHLRLCCPGIEVRQRRTFTAPVA